MAIKRLSVVTTCPAHTETPIIEDAGGKEYCPRCIQAEISPVDAFQLLTRLVREVRLLHGARPHLFYQQFQDALDEAEDFIDTVTRG